MSCRSRRDATPPPLTSAQAVTTEEGGETWMRDLADEAFGVSYSDLVGYLLTYIGTIGRGPAFLAWFRGRREGEKRAGG